MIGLSDGDEVAEVSIPFLTKLSAVALRCRPRTISNRVIVFARVSWTLATRFVGKASNFAGHTNLDVDHGV